MIQMPFFSWIFAFEKLKSKVGLQVMLQRFVVAVIQTYDVPIRIFKIPTRVQAMLTIRRR